MRRAIFDGVAETLSREAEKRAWRRFSADLENFRPGSFPLISADTFRSLANQVIDEGHVARFHPRGAVDVVYLDMRFFQSKQRLVALSDIPGLPESMTGSRDRARAIIITNADIPPSRHQLRELATHFDQVYCANISYEEPGVNPIPVGIENLYRAKNGFPWRFLSNSDDNDLSVRSESIFACFSVTTNRRVRARLREAVRRSRHYFCEERLTPLQFQSRIERAMFVLSPPGNGNDCHRTWESIYLGAVPVIMKNTLPETFTRSLPILEVESYESFLGLSDSELEAEFQLVTQKSREMAYMPYWVSQIYQTQRR